MITIVLLFGCGPRWTEPGAVAPTLAHLDADGSGEVDAAEYQARLFHGAPFEQVDTDKDGELSEEELLQSMLASDPSSLTVPRTGPQVVRGKGKEKKGGGSGKVEDQPVDAKKMRGESQWVVRMTLMALKEEVRTAVPNAATPTDDEIKKAASTGDLRTVESRAVLEGLEKASDAAGIDFPARLRAAALAKEPVVPTPEESADAGMEGPMGPDGPGKGPGGPGMGPGGPGGQGPGGPGRGPGMGPGGPGGPGRGPGSGPAAPADPKGGGGGTP